ncbi:EF-hand domain-containing protein [Roseovarius sp. S4756]|uniref:EF-hand domain-containing protein n=1 Tax=Roseovarius maritimus TaxID=3342637 RepID=UPI00372C8F56
MKRSTFLTTTACALSLITTGGVTAYAQSDASSTDQPAAAAAQYGQGMGKNKQDCRGDQAGKWDGKHGKRHGKHGGRHGEMMRTVMGQIDADKDGTVTMEEIDAFRAAKLAEIDASGDGALSIEEFDTLYREMTRSRMVDMFQKLDADGDGVISSEEMDSRVGRMVERMDRNDDGVLSAEDRGRKN